MTRNSTHDEEDEDFVDEGDSWEEDSDDDDDGGDELSASVDRKNGHRQRDWRDLERYKEERELRRLMEDDYLLDDDLRSHR